MTDNALDPVALARAVAIDAAENPDAVGDYVTQQAMEGGVTDFRFAAVMVGYEAGSGRSRCTMTRNWTTGPSTSPR